MVRVAFGVAQEEFNFFQVSANVFLEREFEGELNKSGGYLLLELKGNLLFI